MSKCVACACGKNYFLNISHCFDAQDALCILHTEVLCHTHGVLCLGFLS